MATTATVLIGLACADESEPPLIERLGAHEHLTTLLPDDATILSEMTCRAETSQTNNACSLIYATKLDLQQAQNHYRAVYDGRGWDRLIDNQEFGRFIWRMEWRDATYKVVATVMEPEDWPGTPVPDGAGVVITATVVERK